MAKQTGEQIIQDSTTEALARSGEAANEIMKGNADVLTESGNASRAAVQELTKAYQELTTKNARNVTAGHCHINRFYCSLLATPLDSDSINSMA
jgi:fructose-1-phosphate kinase PfkB-like protein